MTKEEKQAKNNLRNFLENLARLSRQYGLEIGGCGDCGSPWVAPMDKGSGVVFALQHLTYCHECEKYGEYGQHGGCI